MDSKVLSLIGFSKRANKLVSGSNRVVDAINTRKAKLVILANDVSNNTKDRMKRLASEKNINVIEFSTIEELSNITGEDNKGTFAIIDKTFSEPIIKEVMSN